MAVAHWLEFLRAHGSIENSVTLIIPNLDFLGDLKTWIKWVLYLSYSEWHYSMMRDSGDTNKVPIKS